MLELIGLSLEFGALKVLDRLDLTVERGEVLGILGPNGAGKTTLFNVIVGVHAPSAGRVVFEGRDFGGMRMWHRCRAGVGRTFQVPRPFSEMTVFDNLLTAAVHGAGLSLAEGRLKAEEALEGAGLTHRIAQRAGDLPLLDLKRLELAKAIACRPRLLLLDEIAGGLTDRECEVLLGILRGLREQGITIVWIEHVMHALRGVASRLAVLHGGRIIATGSPGDILADPRVHEIYLGDAAA
jgi:branched-chain amino acid transport system ATP-binding protein